MNITASWNDTSPILVVDDDKFMRLQLRRVMEQAGYQVAEANNGQEALSAYTRLHPAIVLLDVLMPVMDGLTCCRQLQTLPGGDRTPIVMITALEDRESIELAFDAGASDYITKPIHWAVLRQRVRRLLQASRAMQELRQQTERSKASEEQLRLALEAARMGTWDWDIQRNTIVYSDQLGPIFGLPPGFNHPTYEAFLDSVHQSDREYVAQAVNAALKGKDYGIEFRVIWPDGSSHWIGNKGQVYYDDTGVPVRMRGIAMDITERMQAEQERNQLLAQEQAARTEAEIARNRIANILESITDGFYALDKEWRFTYLNQQAEQLLHRKRVDLLGKNMWDEFPQVVGSKFYQEYHRVISQQVRVEFEEFYPPLNSWFVVHAYPAKDGLSVYFQDITDRKQTQAELQRQNLRSQLFSDITLKVRQSLQIDEILQNTVKEVQKLLQADRVLIFRLRANGYGQIITEAVVPGWPSVLGQGINDDCFGAEYLKRYSKGRIYTIADIAKSEVQACLIEFMQEFGVKAKLVMPILLKEELWGLLIAHQCSSPRQWSSFEVDLLQQLADQIGIALAQAQLLAEETRQRQELIRSNDELQQFASIASHDLQEPLRKIQAFGNRLKATCGGALNEQGLDYLERMQNAAQRMQALIDDLLILSRITTQAQPFVDVALAQITQEVLSDLEERLQETNGRVEVAELLTIEADPVQMRQLLQNLLSNALKFHRQQEPPVVKIYSQLFDQKWQPVEESAIATHCQIVVADNGIGFDEKYLDRIFNVFQRLHSRSEYEGTGMGLAICRKIAERHGGSITAKSTPGQGSTFIVTLPIKQRLGENIE